MSLLRNSILEWSSKRATAISLRDLYKFNVDASDDKNQRILNSQFLHRELPIRLAQRIQELYSIPFGLVENKNICYVRDLYMKGFQSLLEFKKPESLIEDEYFTKQLKSVLDEHEHVIQLMAIGVLERKKEIKFDAESTAILNLFLNRFFMARIGIRFLIAHHIASKTKQIGCSGIIHSEVDPTLVARKAADESIHLCERRFGTSPEIHIMSPHPITFTYVPGHLQYILSELFKNSLRATMVHHGEEGAKLPIEVVIVAGETDITIKVSDKGGGVPFSKMDNCWTYVYTSYESQKATSTSSSSGSGTSSTTENDNSNITMPTSSYGGVGKLKFKDACIETIEANAPTLAGYGCGLPISRLYSQYFGGGLDLKSMEGYGTDAYIYLNRLGKNCENLPKGVQLSPAERDSSFLTDFTPNSYTKLI